MTDFTVTVLSPALVPLGLINTLTSFNWTTRMDDFDGFTLWAPIDKDNTELIKRGNIIYLSENKVGVIETIQQSMDEAGPYLQVSGRSIECWLKRRVLWENVSMTSQISNILRELVNKSVISPSIPERVLQFVRLDPTQEVLGSSITYTSTRGELWSELDTLSRKNNITQKLILNLENKYLTYTLYKPKDRSIEQTVNSVVILSTDFDDVLASQYTADETTFSNVALVQGASRSTTVNPSLSGEQRREIYVDAKDLDGIESWGVEETIYTELEATFTAKVQAISATQVTDLISGKTEIKTTVEVLDSTAGPPVGRTEEQHVEGNQLYHTITETSDLGTAPSIYKITTLQTRVSQLTGEHVSLTNISYISGTSTTPGVEHKTYTDEVPMTPERYEAQLQERGKSKLLEQRLVEGFEFNLKTSNVTSFAYGVDYTIGDRITIQDKNLGVQVSTEISSAEEVWDDRGHTLTISLGTSAPTITQLIRRIK